MPLIIKWEILCRSSFRKRFLCSCCPILVQSSAPRNLCPSARLTFAPLAASNDAMSWRPYLQAHRKGVSPRGSATSNDSPYLRMAKHRIRTTSKWPPTTAWCSAVNPSKSFRFTSTSGKADSNTIPTYTRKDTNVLCAVCMGSPAYMNHSTLKAAAAIAKEP